MPLTPAQRARRRLGIGASDVAAVLGLDPRRSPLAVYLEKTGELPDSPETTEQRMGHALEPVVADLYREAHPEVLLTGSPTLQHPEVPHFLATPDRLAFAPEAVPQSAWLTEAEVLPARPHDGYPVEIKTRRFSMAQAFGVPGTDQVPAPIALQVHWQLLVAGGPHADVALLVDGRDYREYRVYADAAIAAHLMTTIDRWWRRHVAQRVPPELDGSPVTAAWLARRTPQTSEQIRAADLEEEALLEALAAARQDRLAAEAREALLENHVKAAIGACAGLEGRAARIVWRQGKDRRVIDWQAVAMALGVSPALVEAHTSTRPGARPFHVTLRESAPVEVSA